MISIILISSFLLIINIACSNKILIINYDDESDVGSKLSQSIKYISGDQFKIEEIGRNAKVPDIISLDDDQPLYNTIYYFKSSTSTESSNGFDWPVSQVINFVQNGGNFFCTFFNWKLLDEFGMDMIEGTDFIPNSKLQWNYLHSFSSLSKDSIQLLNVPVKAFKLRNDPKYENFNPLIQNSLTFSENSGICASTCQSNTQSISMLATLESRQGSRFAVASSTKLLSLLSEPVLNGIFGWVQGTKFSIKISSFSHQLSNSNSSPNRGRTELDSTIYRINDKINIRMCLTTPSSISESTRFIPENAQDFQFELKMMNIQLRKSFDFIDSDGCLISSNVQLPSKPAVYTLQINYNRPGWSQLSHKERLLIRPFRHDEFPRFLKVAMPYYFSWIGILVASYLILLPNFFKQLKL